MQRPAHPPNLRFDEWVGTMVGHTETSLPGEQKKRHTHKENVKRRKKDSGVAEYRTNIVRIQERNHLDLVRRRGHFWLQRFRKLQ